MFAKRFKTDPVELVVVNEAGGEVVAAARAGAELKSPTVRLPVLSRRKDSKPRGADKDGIKYLDPVDRKKIADIGRKIEKLSRLSEEQ